MMSPKAWTFFLFLAISTVARAQTLALTFDDGLDPRVQSEAAAWNQSILDGLAKSHVTAMLLPACKNVDSPEGMALVRAWGHAGHAVGNHTYSHWNLASPDVSAQDFIADAQKCEARLRGIEGWTPRLRFPYLKEGDTAQKRDAVRSWMAQGGYRPAAVSIDTSDWYYNNRLLAWRKAHPNADLAPYRAAYLAHLWDRANYYDGLSKKVLGRSVEHVMLLHTNAINALFIGDVVAMFRSRGWKIVSPVKAFDDPVYAKRADVLPAGESVLWALAKQAGVAGLRYPAEDGEYEAALVDDVERKSASEP